VVPEVPHELEEAVSIWDEVEPATENGGEFKVWFDTDECDSRNFVLATSVAIVTTRISR